MDERNEKKLQHEVTGNMDSQHGETKKKEKTILPSSYLSESNKENWSLPQASVHLLQKYYETKLMPEQSSNAPSITPPSRPQELSLDGILKMARERLLRCTTQNFDVVSVVVSDLFNANSGLSPEKNEDFELALLLQAAALKFSHQQFDRARKFLNICQTSASVAGNALHRITHYFSLALQERISREIGGLVQEEPEGNPRIPTVEEALTILQPAIIECQHKLPFCQVTQFTAIQAIVDNVASAKRVHLVDLGIKSGSHWPIMMQALAGRHECPLELLKITAVGPSKEIIEETGQMLSSFAETMNIPFAFKVIVSDMKNLKEDLFELAADEVLAVYSEMRLASLLSSPHHLESLVGTIEKLNPCVMVITELEASINTSRFLERFDALLSICAAVFDCLDDCIDRENTCRAIIEGVFFWEGIRNIITTEGEERFHRQETLDFWRDFLSRFGIVELALSDLALCQSNLVLRSNPRWSSCTIELNGKALIIGWKGTPIQSLSVWKFRHD